MNAKKVIAEVVDNLGHLEVVVVMVEETVGSDIVDSHVWQHPADLREGGQFYIYQTGLNKEKDAYYDIIVWVANRQDIDAVEHGSVDWFNQHMPTPFNDMDGQPRRYPIIQRIKDCFRGVKPWTMGHCAAGSLSLLPREHAIRLVDEALRMEADANVATDAAWPEE